MRSAPKALKLGSSYECAFSPDGNYVAAVSLFVSMWGVRSGAKIWKAHPLKHPSQICFDPSGERLAVKSTSGKVMLLDAHSGEVVADLGSRGDAEGGAMAFTPDGSRLVDSSWTDGLLVRDVLTGAIQYAEKRPNDMARGVHVDSRGQQWVIWHSCRATTSNRSPDEDYVDVRQWPFSEHEPRRVGLGSFFVRDTALSGAGTLLAVSYDGRDPWRKVRVLDLSSHRWVGETPTDMCFGLAWSTADDRIATVQRDAIIEYSWPGLVKVASWPMEYPQAVAYSPAGDRLALGSAGHGMVIYTGTSGEASEVVPS